MESSNDSVPQIVGNTANIDRINNDVEYNDNEQNRDRQLHIRQNLICFWTIGLCNFFGCTVMGSAAFDIIKGLNVTV